jgi:hypothetical protein
MGIVIGPDESLGSSFEPVGMTPVVVTCPNPRVMEISTF